MRRRAVAAALAVAALVLSGCGFNGLYSAPLPGGADLGSHPKTVTAYFADVLDLVPQSAVKVNDVAVGKVTGISLSDCTVKSGRARRWCAKVTMQVNGSVQLPANARAEVEQTSLLGEKYVALQNPTGPAASKQLASGAVIKYDDTTSAPEVEQVLGALSLLLNEGGLRQIKSIALELNKALGSQQRRRAVRDLITQLNTFASTLDDQKGKITTALDSLDTLARTLNSQKTIITDALDTFPQALSVLRQETPKLVTLLASLSHLGTIATRVIGETQTNLVSSLKKLGPVLTRLTASGGNFPKSLRILGTFPFPLGASRQFVKGDYANLDAVFNLNLTDQLCGALNIGCPSPATAKAQKVGNNRAGADRLPPTLIGAGK